MLAALDEKAGGFSYMGIMMLGIVSVSSYPQVSKGLSQLPFSLGQLLSCGLTYGSQLCKQQVVLPRSRAC